MAFRSNASLLVAPVFAMLLSMNPSPAAAEDATASAANVDAGRQLNQLLDAYFEDYLKLNPVLATFIGDDRYNDSFPNSIGPEYRAAEHALNQRYLDAVKAIDPAALSQADRISYDIFLRERARALEAERFPSYLLPINQAGSIVTFMPVLGSGENAQPFNTVQDYENWLKRLDGFAVWMDQAIVNMREGVAKGVVQPRPVMEKVLPQLEAMIVEKPEDSLFYAVVQKFPEDFSAADKERLAAAYAKTISDTVTPAYRRMHDFVRDEYLPKTRSSVAWTALPDGEAWYAFLVSEHTTTTMTPAEIHELGVSEVARILGEMDGMRSKVGFVGDLQAFFTFLETDPQF